MSLKICIALLFGLVFLSEEAKAQNGYLGKKNIIGIDGFGAYPILTRPSDYKVFKEKDGRMIESREYFNPGFSVYYMRNIKKRYSIGAEFVSRQFLSPSPTFDTVVFSEQNSNFFYDTLFLKAENLKMLTRGFMLRFEFHGTKGMGPIGYTHIAGIGYNRTYLQQNFYRYSLNEIGNTENDEVFESEVDTYVLNKIWPEYQSLQVQYGLMLRYPVTEYLAVDAGIKYLVNVYWKSNEETIQEFKGDPFDYEFSYFDVQLKNFINLNAKIGLSLMF